MSGKKIGAEGWLRNFPFAGRIRLLEAAFRTVRIRCERRIAYFIVLCNAFGTIFYIFCSRFGVSPGKLENYTHMFEKRQQHTTDVMTLAIAQAKKSVKEKN